MAKKADLSSTALLPWDAYKDKPADEVLPSMYARVEATSRSICTWYWRSIKSKRSISLAARAVTFVLLIVGTALPILAGLLENVYVRLAFTQWAVALLAVAGLIQVADRVFGWSSGWMRYITTVTSMEHLTRRFELDWAAALLAMDKPPTLADLQALFELAKAHELTLLSHQSEETAKWVSEFSAGMTLLDTLIKTQREETERTLESVKTTIAAQQNTTKAEQNEKRPGALELTLVHKAEPKEVRIFLDNEPPEDFLGLGWAKKDIEPGHHTLRIQTLDDSPQEIVKVVEIPAAGVARYEIKLGT